MAEYVIVDPDDAGTTLAQITVDDQFGTALVHHMVGVSGARQFGDLEEVRAALALSRPTFEIRPA